MSNGMVNTFTTMGNSQGSNSYLNVNTFYSSGNISITNNFIQSSINRLTSPSVNVNSFYGSNNVGATQNYSPIVNTFTSTTPNITTQTFTTPMQDRVSTIQTFTRSTPSVTSQTNTIGSTSDVINVGGGMTGGVMPFSSRNGMMTNQNIIRVGSDGTMVSLQDNQGTLTTSNGQMVQSNQNQASFASYADLMISQAPITPVLLSTNPSTLTTLQQVNTSM